MHGRHREVLGQEKGRDEGKILRWENRQKIYRYGEAEGANFKSGKPLPRTLFAGGKILCDRGGSFLLLPRTPAEKVSNDEDSRKRNSRFVVDGIRASDNKPTFHKVSIST